MSAKRRKPARARSNRPPETAAPQAAAPRWLPWTVAAGLIALTVFVFAGVREHGFIDLDDGLYVTENANVRGGLTGENISWAFTTGRAGNWHPLTWISHQADATLFGMNASSHHLINLAWHTLNVLMIFGWLRSVTGALWRSALVAALFAIHPAHVESVAWISERKDVLSTFFLVAATWAWCSWTRTPSRRSWLIALAAFALGLMSKPMLMTLPFVWLLLDIWPLGRQQVPLRARLLEKLPFFILVAASVVVTFVMQREGGAVTGLDLLPAGERIANAITSYGRYLAMLVWPRSLTVFYSYEATIPAALVAGAAMLVAAVSAAAWLARRALPSFAVGWLWFVGMLVPVIGLIQIGMQSHADRYTYVPYVGLFIAIAWLAGALAQRGSIARALTVIVSSGVVVALSAVAHAQVATWRSSETLWTHAITVMPENAKAHNSLGAIYGNTGRVREAEAQFKEALRLRPDLTEGLHIYPNLGRALMAQGKLGEAIQYMERARQLKPADADLAHELGMAYLGANRPAEAISAWRDAVRLNPQLEQTWFVLGISLAATGQVAEARHAFTEVLRINPGRPDAATALQRLR